MRFVEIKETMPVELSNESVELAIANISSGGAPAHFPPTGKRGCVWARSDDGRCLVQTLDGDIIELKEDDLADVELEPSSSGGFDALWPLTEEGIAPFTTHVVELLATRGYCVVQTSLPSEELEECLAAAEDLSSWSLIPPEVEKDYLGSGPPCKSTWLVADAPAEFESCEEYLSGLSLLLSRQTPSLGFRSEYCTPTLLRAPLSSEDDRSLADEAEAMTLEQLAFAARRKLCLLLVVAGAEETGTIALRGAATGHSTVHLPCQSNRLLVFRHDLLEYSCTLDDEGSVALTLWMLRSPLAGEEGLVAGASLGHRAYEEVPAAPIVNDMGQAINCTSLAAMFPGGINSDAHYWAFLSTCTDGAVETPINRWDNDIYWQDTNPGESPPGKMYVRHFSFLNDEQMFSFDHAFFGITKEETFAMDAPQRLSIEVGYECLFNAGWTKPKLNGADMAVCFGNAGSDYWSAALEHHPYNLYSRTFRVESSVQAATNRLSYLFGLTGPTLAIDTACSSSLCAMVCAIGAMRPKESSQRPASSMNETANALVVGTKGDFHPGFAMSQCNSMMLSRNGRCFTFDASADGYNRGEGCGAMHFRKSSDSEDPWRLAMACGANVNQDGRSATLTAPNGPSQQECIRQSLRQGGIRPLQVHMQELHGTGTALGDPIEVGALRATLMTENGEVRVCPLAKTSAKSNFGHMEVSAGVAGAMKCVFLLLHATAAPNVHLVALNPHLDTAGYPVLFPSEAVPQPCSGYAGVSSFGFTGCNARMDFWGRALAGPSATGSLDLGPGRRKLVEFLSGAKDTGREEFTLIDSAYQKEIEWDVRIAGTWNGWRDVARMEQVAQNVYQHRFVMGDALREEFQIVCIAGDGDVLRLFPASPHAGQDAVVLGPGTAPRSHSWVVDGRQLGMHEGEACVARLWWDVSKGQKSVSWSCGSTSLFDDDDDDNDRSGAASEDAGQEEGEGRPLGHRYSILASWTAWKPIPLRAAQSGGHELTFRIGGYGHEDFRFVRDGDEEQMIYPAAAGATKTTVPVRGPDAWGRDKAWCVRGPVGEAVTVKLTVEDGELSVTTACAVKGSKCWRGRAGEVSYYALGSWPGAEPVLLEPLPGRKPSRRFQGILELPEGQAAGHFQVLVDGDPRRAVYPELHSARSGLSMACGPDAKGAGLCWVLERGEGALRACEGTFEVRLDLGQEDRRRRVTWAPVVALGVQN